MSSCESGAGGNGGDGGSISSSVLPGGDGGLGGNGGNGGALSMAYFSPNASLDLWRCILQFSSTGPGGNGGDGGSGGNFMGLGSSGGDAGGNGRGGLLFAILGVQTNVSDQCAFISGSIQDGGRPGSGDPSDGQVRSVSTAGAGLYLGVHLDMTRSSITRCDASGLEGGGIYHAEGVLRLASCTASGNQAARGGFLQNSGNGEILINHGTIAENTSSGSFGAIGGTAPAKLRSTLVVENTSATGAFDVQVWLSSGFNLLDSANAAGLPNDFVGPSFTIAAMLPSFASPVPQIGHYPMPNTSRSVDHGFPLANRPAGDPFLFAATDILGLPRLIGRSTDIGATENASSVDLHILGCRQVEQSGKRFFELELSVSQTPMPLAIVGNHRVSNLSNSNGTPGNPNDLFIIRPIYRTATDPISTFLIDQETLFTNFSNQFQIGVVRQEPALLRFFSLR